MHKFSLKRFTFARKTAANWKLKPKPKLFECVCILSLIAVTIDAMQLHLKAGRNVIKRLVAIFALYIEMCLFRCSVANVLTWTEIMSSNHTFYQYLYNCTTPSDNQQATVCTLYILNALNSGTFFVSFLSFCLLYRAGLYWLLFNHFNWLATFSFHVSTRFLWWFYSCRQ